MTARLIPRLSGTPKAGHRFAGCSLTLLRQFTKIKPFEPKNILIFQKGA
jgi:hypothetical protein